MVPSSSHRYITAPFCVTMEVLACNLLCPENIIAGDKLTSLGWVYSRSFVYMALQPKR